MNMKITSALVLGLALTACSNGATMVHVNRSVLGIFATPSAPEANGMPVAAGGLYSANAEITPLENADGSPFVGEWIEHGADGSRVEVRDAYASCFVSRGNIWAELGMGQGEVLHASGSGMGGGEMCAAIGEALRAE